MCNTYFEIFHQQGAEVVTCKVLSQSSNYADKRDIIIIIRLKLQTVDQRVRTFLSLCFAV